MNNNPLSDLVSNANQVPLKCSVFDHEKLRVYPLLLQFITWVTPLIEDARKIARAKTREVCDQLDRASLSSLLNTAEGNGKRQGQIRAKFFDDARGSATECAACLDALVAKGVFAAERVLEGKAMLLRIVSMLCGLVDRFDESSGRFRDEPLQYDIRSALETEDRIKYRIGDQNNSAPRKRKRTRKRKEARK
jgi:four helix bundle protein